MANNHLYVVDGSGFIFRAFYALPPMTRPDGTPINAVYGFSNMLIKLLMDAHADHLIVAFDAGRHTFRNDLYADYKANRDSPPEELIPQFGLIRAACDAFNVPRIEIPGYEADDIIATYTRLARARDMDVTIVSSDKDLMQLVGDGIEMMDPLKDKKIGPDEVMEKFGVAPNRVIDVQALAGDTSDNVPGVPGIGIKTAAALIKEYGDLEGLLSNTDSIKQPKRREKLQNHAEDARISKELVTLRADVPLEDDIEDLTRKDPEPATLEQFLLEMNFSSILARIEKKGFALNGNPQAPEPKASYQLVQSMDQLSQWIEDATDAGVVAIDTETTSLNPMRADLVGISLATAPGKACYIPLAHKVEADGDTFFEKKPTIEQIELQQAIDALKPLLTDQTVLKVGQNLKYDMHVLQRYGIDLSPIDDTMVLSYVNDGSLHGHGMDELAELFLGVQTIKFQDVVGKGKAQKTFDYVELDKACEYAAEDADITLKLYNILKPKLFENRLVSVYETMERPLINILLDMETEGIKVDVERLQELSRDFTQRMAVLEEDIFKLAGRSFNVGSPKQLGVILFDELDLPGGKMSKTGAYATGAEVLEDLVVQGHELPAKVLDWRMLAKLKSTYSDALVEQINPNTGRIHTSYGMTVASTGRLSSNNPNLQNIPIRSTDGLKIREAFVAKEGHQLISLDYSQIELRLLAHVADIPELQESFLNGADIHRRAASEVFGVPQEEVDDALRSRAKMINFGIIYGISAHGLSRQLRVPRGDAAAYIKHYLERYPGIAEYMEEMKDIARKQGFVTTLFGRRCYVPYINDKNPARRGFGERQAINAPLQGSNADIIKRAMIKIPEALEKAGLSSKMLLQVHDELIFEAADAEVEKTIEVVKPIMENMVQLKVPLKVDSGIGKTWASAK
ncbi:MAG: DNA polymerase I [Alphaproteobacteria bacterium]